MRRIHLEIEGIVQGVGFRPFLHRLARKCGLAGWCRNTVFGVELELEGEEDALTAFQTRLRPEAPPLARITHLRLAPCPAPLGEGTFSILESRRTGRPDTLVSPDIATCPQCLKELRDPKDRRFRYPFLNCTDCGPRFTIVKALPYDRPLTSMAPFPLCPDCRKEYGDINTRRYHAQPDCCPRCGPTLRFFSRAFPEGTDADPIGEAARLLERGEILAIQGLGGFHLAARPDLPETVARLRALKHRDERPFALMARDPAAAEALCRISPGERARLLSPRAPIVLLQKREDCPEGLSQTGEVGILLPYTPLHHLLMDHFPLLIMTSMNRSDAPVRTALTGGSGEALALSDGQLLHDRAIVNRCDDSLLRVFRGKDYFFRRSRGYAPEPISVQTDCSGLLACGAEQKASFALGRGKNVFPAQHIGDLKDLETEDFYREQIRRYEEQFGVPVQRLVSDLHPDYRSTRYARERSLAQGLPLVQVQHHHAHMAACMADNGLDGDCIGLLWDGTGYGTDGTIWGAECLAGGYEGFRRLGSIRPILLPGGDRCARDIGRVAHSLLWAAGLSGRSHHPQAGQLTRMLERKLNAPAASSMGRLFDGVYSLLTGRQTVTYEGQGAILLEAMADHPQAPGYPLQFSQEGLLRWETAHLTRQLLSDLDKGLAPGEIASRFLNTLPALALSQAQRAREETGLSRVVLSGGCFLDRWLLTKTMETLEGGGFTPYCHSRVSPNDQGIALGQILIAAKGGGTPCV